MFELHSAVLLSLSFSLRFSLACANLTATSLLQQLTPRSHPVDDSVESCCEMDKVSQVNDSVPTDCMFGITQFRTSKSRNGSSSSITSRSITSSPSSAWATESEMSGGVPRSIILSSVGLQGRQLELDDGHEGCHEEQDDSEGQGCHDAHGCFQEEQDGCGDEELDGWNFENIIPMMASDSSAVGL